MIRRVRAAILCDDVRQEDNGKGLLIGVYGRQLLAGQRPTMIGLNLQLAFDVDADQNEVELRMRALSERVQKLTLNAVRGYCTLSIGLNIALTEPRQLRVDIRNPEGAWLECGEWDLGFADNAEEAPLEFAEAVKEAAQRMLAESNSAAEV